MAQNTKKNILILNKLQQKTNVQFVISKYVSIYDILKSG